MLRSFYSIILVCVTSAALFAQFDDTQRTGGYARLLGMGNNPYVVDPYFTAVNPAWASIYSNFLWGDLGSQQTPWGNDGVGQFAGFNFRVNRNITFGGILSRNDFQGLSISSLAPANTLVNDMNQAGPRVISLNNNLELIGAFRLGNAILGVGVAYASSVNDVNPPQGNSSEGSASQLGLNVGILTKLGPIVLDAGASIILPGATYSPGTGGETDYSGTVIGVFGRAFIRSTSRLQLVPAVGFISTSGSYDIPNAPTGDFPSSTTIAVGFGINYQVGDDILIAGGPGLRIESTTEPEVDGLTPELTESSFIFPIWNLGAEWKFADWIIGRLGYTASTGQNTEEEKFDMNRVTENVTTFYGVSGVTVGLGFRFGETFSLDATVNEDVLRQGLANIGGNGPTFAYLSASLAF